LAFSHILLLFSLLACSERVQKSQEVLTTLPRLFKVSHSTQ